MPQGELISKIQHVVMGREDQLEGDNRCVNLSNIWPEYIDDIIMPILWQSNRSIPSYDTNDTIPEKDKDEDSYDPVLKTLVDNILLGYLQIYKDPLKLKNSTTAYQSNQVTVKIYRED